MMNELRRMTFQPSIESASRLLHDYAELQRASDRLLDTALQMGVNPTDVRELIKVQREMLGGALTLAVGQVDMLKIYARDARFALAAEAATSRDAPVPATAGNEDVDDPTGFDAGRLNP